MSNIIVVSTLNNDAAMLHALVDKFNMVPSETLLIGGGLFEARGDLNEPDEVTYMKFMTLCHYLDGITNKVIIGTRKDYLFETSLNHPSLGQTAGQGKILGQLRSSGKGSDLMLVQKLLKQMVRYHVVYDEQIRTTNLFTPMGLNKERKTEEVAMHRPSDFSNNRDITGFLDTCIKSGDRNTRFKCIDDFDEIYVTASPVQQHGAFAPFRIGNVYMTDTAPGKSFNYADGNVSYKGHMSALRLFDDLYISARNLNTQTQLDYDSIRLRTSTGVQEVHRNYVSAAPVIIMPDKVEITPQTKINYPLPIVARKQEKEKVKLDAYIE